MPRQMLMTKEVEKSFEQFPLYSQDGKGLDAIVSAKFFSPYTGWTWLLTEYDPVDRLFFGLVLGLEVESGYVDLSELEQVNASRDPQPVERDAYFTPKTLREALAELGRNDLIEMLDDRKARQ